MIFESQKRAIYAVIVFSRAQGGVAVAAPREALDEDTALRLARRLAETRLGAVAYYRIGDPEIGVFDDPVVVGEFGLVPYEVKDLVA